MKGIKKEIEQKMPTKGDKYIATEDVTVWSIEKNGGMQLKKGESVTFIETSMLTATIGLNEYDLYSKCALPLECLNEKFIKSQQTKEGWKTTVKVTLY